MSILYNDDLKLITLETRSTTYQMKVDEHGFLIHLYYGKNIGRTDMSYLIRNYDRGFSGNPYESRFDRTFSLDTALQEYTSCGAGDFRISTISVANPDGSYRADFRYVSHEVHPGKYRIPGLPSAYGSETEADTLIVTLQDDVTHLTVKLYYGVFGEIDVITRYAEICNEGEELTTLHKAASACLDFPPGKWDLIHFHGRHCMERQFERVPLLDGIQTISSTRGISSHQHNPFVILSGKKTTEDAGDCYGIMLMYSGNHRIDIERDQMEGVRVVAGIHDSEFAWTLAPGEKFHTPEVLLSYSGEGLTNLSHNYHDMIRGHVCLGIHNRKRRPVLLNSWEAMYFDFTEEKLINLAREAADLGIELFVLDDGWFGTRNDDNQGLGDWFVNREKLPHGLGWLADEIRGMGMEFGLWIEPEMVNENSNLYREHPDWAMRPPKQDPVMCRNQLVLDLSREDVVEYLYEAISALLKEAKISYIKWDMNRPITDVFSAAYPPSRQGEISHRYMLGLYNLMSRLTGDFPDVLFEGCSGGGGRFDAGILQYSPQIWCSDDTDAIKRIRIQHGTSFGYPISTVGAHVSASPNHQTGRDVPLSTRGIVAMAGTFGYELDLGKLTEAEKDEIREQIKTFDCYYDLIQNGRYYRLSNPTESEFYHAWQFVSRDKSESLLNVVVYSPRPNAPLIRIRLKGLDPDAMYRIGDESFTVSGAALMNGGYTLPLMHGNYPSFQIHLEKL